MQARKNASCRNTLNGYTININMDIPEIKIYLLDREFPINVNPDNSWTAEYATRLVAGKYLGIRSVALEVILPYINLEIHIVFSAQ